MSPKAGSLRFRSCLISSKSCVWTPMNTVILKHFSPDIGPSHLTFRFDPYPLATSARSTSPMASKQKSKLPFQLTPEQIALQATRRELKAQKARQAASSPVQTHIVRREWASVQHGVKDPEERITIMTWNVRVELYGLQTFDHDLGRC